ncbi:23S rRNA (guanine(1835)-N(2))-methyltransferase [Oceanisphaera profunda]|uniref:Ribosomal RNA large subunit methyltransferase G n=1 Tax=Oceanisphaera profunda TaxID=1416627 RepID=A0A1Y0D7X2_9GAMM|nr:methyltransferase [Oceanisphaera profunda]ART83236.1 23S rRNA (guanine(1835)-N(2))-methyltransferase [Oceanisphaera profunda]
MNHHFPLPGGGELSLLRYPRKAQDKLQAWEAADEYLINELAALELDASTRVLILNDGFGALTLALHNYQPYSLTDSRISELACTANAHDNQLPETWQTLSSLASWPSEDDAPQVVLIKLPKNNAMLEYQLAQLSQIVSPQTRVIAAGKAKEVRSSTLALFERYLGPTKTSLAWKKARLIFCTPDPKLKAAALPQPLAWPLDGTDFTLYNHANVFARSSLDIAARLFLEHLPKEQSGHIVDLGCGNGVLGLMALVQNPQAEVTFTDESYMAIASARHNVQHNLPQALTRAHFSVNNCLDGVASDSIDIILCNPPFHQQQAITDHIAWEMFVDAKRVLRSGGELWVVGNRHLDYHHKLIRLFGNQTVVASNPKFVILKAIQPS